MNLLHDHPSEDVRAALIRFLDALCQWERATGRANVVIIKDSAGGEYRALQGSPVPDEINDESLLDAYKNLAADQQ